MRACLSRRRLAPARAQRRASDARHLHVHVPAPPRPPRCGPCDRRVQRVSSGVHQQRGARGLHTPHAEQRSLPPPPAPPPPRARLSQVNDHSSTSNTPVRRAHERLLRQLHQLPHAPAVMELVVFRCGVDEGCCHPGASPAAGAAARGGRAHAPVAGLATTQVDAASGMGCRANSLPILRWAQAEGLGGDAVAGTPSSTPSPARTPPRMQSAGDDELGVLAQYYHTPWFATRSLMWDEWAATSASTLPGWMGDENHPNTLGHRRAHAQERESGRGVGRVENRVAGRGRQWRRSAGAGAGRAPAAPNCQAPAQNPVRALPSPSSHPPAGTWLT